ncbi:MAG: PIN domain-containing protein, partial [Acidobacteriota bacterium]
IALDSNLLIYAHRSDTSEHEPARKAIERAANSGRGWGTPLPCLSEFGAIVTHPRAEGGPSRPEQACSFIDALVVAGCRIWSPGEGFWTRLAELAVERDIGGPRIFDLQIGLIAADQGVREIWTHDRNFVAPSRIQTHDPLVSP